MEKTLKVAIQGIRGAFHETAAKKYFGENADLELVQCNTFHDLFDALYFKNANYGVVAIENSLVGSILPNYNLLRESKLKILGEIYLRIDQHLVSLPGQKIEDIREIHSHPMAIQQCQDFLTPLRRNGVRLIDTEDTAKSARRIQEEKLTDVAAISSELAAELYELEIIARSIETNKMNFTRFLIVSNEENYKSHLENKEVDKSSICFTLPHEEGSLSHVLSVLAYYKINLSKIQSLPIIGKNWEYLFYADLIFNDFEKYQQSLSAILPLTKELKILGEYQKKERPNGNKSS